MDKKEIIRDVSAYYEEKLNKHGLTSKGVDWNSNDSQEIRFNQLLKIIDFDSKYFSLLDYGCGFGSLLPYLRKKIGKNFNYIGYDIAEQMLDKARETHKDDKEAIWLNSLKKNEAYVDYVIASGMFNVKLKQQDKLWKDYILDTLNKFNTLSKKGFAFNLLTSYSDKEHMKDYLYYADPAFFFDYCKENFSRNVALLHDYELYEFTLLIKK